MITVCVRWFIPCTSTGLCRLAGSFGGFLKDWSCCRQKPPYSLRTPLPPHAPGPLCPLTHKHSQIKSKPLITTRTNTKSSIHLQNLQSEKKHSYSRTNKQTVVQILYEVNPILNLRKYDSKTPPPVYLLTSCRICPLNKDGLSLVTFFPSSCVFALSLQQCHNLIYSNAYLFYLPEFLCPAQCGYYSF